MFNSRSLVARRVWMGLASLGAALLVYEPLASAVDAPMRTRPLPTLHVTVPQPPTVQMTSFFPNPSKRVQAVGTSQQARNTRRTDRSAYLKHATQLELDGVGYRVLGQGMRRYYGTYELVELIQQSGAIFAERYPDSDEFFQVGDLSRERGGTIRDSSGRRVHSSHRNGLDVDINYLRRACDRDPGDLREQDAFGRYNNPRCRFHLRKNMELMRDFVRGGPEDEQSLVSVFFVSPAFAKRACRAAKRRPAFGRRYDGVLSRMKVMSGHQAHFHVRLRCPENSVRCHDAKIRRRNPCRR